MNTIRLVALAAILSCPVSHSELRVVATLSTFADLAQTIGGEHVDVDYIAPPRFNPHFVEPKPSDVLRVKKCGVFIHGGLDLEVWRAPLLRAAGNAKIGKNGAGEIDLSKYVKLLNIPQGELSRAQGDIHAYGNPHYWLGQENGLSIARAIATR